MFACKKKCHGEICKVYKVKDDQKITWNHDRKDGEDDPNISDNLLIKWVTTKATTQNSIMGKQGWVVQGRRMYATRLQT